MDIVKADIQTVLDDKELYDCLDNSIVFITGATGFIGSMLLKSMVEANSMHGLDIRVIGLIRDYDKAQRVLGAYVKYVELVEEYDVKCDYIIHTISPTTSKYFIEHPVETIKSSVESTMKILEVAKNNNARMVYLSSMEQYGIPYKAGEVMTEDKIGVINHLSVRSSYSESKRLCECLCASYASEYGVDVRIARLAQTFGAGVSLDDNRMPMQFARAVVENKDIILHTEGKSIVNSIYITDVITAILYVLNIGKKGEVYNVCNDGESSSVKEIAELVCKEVAHSKIKVTVDAKEDMGYAPDVTMYLDSKKLQKLGWNVKTSLSEGYEKLVEYISAFYKNRSLK